MLDLPIEWRVNGVGIGMLRFLCNMPRLSRSLPHVPLGLQTDQMHLCQNTSLLESSVSTKINRAKLDLLFASNAGSA
jgi:hypothetical protein